MKSWVWAMLCGLLACEAVAEYRTWTDRSGNLIEAELVKKFGTQVVLRDKKGSILKVDVAKLSEEDRLYLDPPTPETKRYKIGFARTSSQTPVSDGKAQLTQRFALVVEFLTYDALDQGLKGAFLAIGADGKGNYVVLDKAEGPLEMVERYKGELCVQEITHRMDGEKPGGIIQGVRYAGHLVVLYAPDGSVLEQQQTHGFLENHARALTFEVGDRFNERLEKIDKAEP